jgi:N6-adenosine-specific RNA methylase IME4
MTTETEPAPDGAQAPPSMPARFQTIVADPPWPVSTVGNGKYMEYPLMPYDWIKALPVADIAEDNAHLYIWTINAAIPQTYATAIAWGFQPSQLLTWGKPPHGSGLGGVFVSTSEYILFCRRGKSVHKARALSTWYEWPRQKRHSEKPREFYDLVEKVSPGPYAELFARTERPGWFGWGDDDGLMARIGMPAPSRQEIRAARVLEEQAASGNIEVTE